MQDRMRSRLEELEREFTAGQARLQELVAQEQSLRETLSQIMGAIRVLRELLDVESTEDRPTSQPPGEGPREGQQRTT